MEEFKRIKEIDVYKYNLPDDVQDSWLWMIELIEEFNYRKLNLLPMYFEIFIQDMERRGFTRDEIEQEVKLYYQRKKNRRGE